MTANKIKKHQEKMKKARMKEDTCSPIEQCAQDSSEWQETRTVFTCTLPHCAAEFRTREAAEQHMVGVHALYDDPVTSITS